MIHIRNFSIIAHIDHGKSTLADRLIEYTGLVDQRHFRNQMLDTMDIERERGITIKSQSVCLPYTRSNGERYELNLIDTPGHVDFSYEVSRALASCEGVLLLVDAAQGVEAQTVANLYAALEQDLEIIPVINKIDLPSADIERVKEEIEVELGLDASGALLCSAKEGIGIEALLDRLFGYPLMGLYWRQRLMVCRAILKRAVAHFQETTCRVLRSVRARCETSEADSLQQTESFRVYPSVSGRKVVGCRLDITVTVLQQSESKTLLVTGRQPRGVVKIRYFSPRGLAALVEVDVVVEPQRRLVVTAHTGPQAITHEARAVD